MGWGELLYLQPSLEPLERAKTTSAESHKNVEKEIGDSHHPNAVFITTFIDALLTQEPSYSIEV